jgi:hypothetical protein
MTERVFEDTRSFEVSGGGRSVEVYAFEGGDVMITADEDGRWYSQRANFTMTHEEATLLKEFLIKQGY